MVSQLCAVISLIHSQTTTPYKAREFLSRKGVGRVCPFPPEKISSLWIKAFHIWSNIRSSRFLMHSEKSNASNPAHHLAQTPRQLVGSLLHTQQSLCQDECPRVTGTIAVQNNVSEAGAVASGADAGRCRWQRCCNGPQEPWDQLLCRFISPTLRKVPEVIRDS